jgi:hypothetical protein
MAVLPRYPSRTTDNQYYLQPMRHLYALATEHRLIRVEDVDSGEQLRVPVQVRRTRYDRSNVELNYILISRILI